MGRIQIALLIAMFTLWLPGCPGGDPSPDPGHGAVEVATPTAPPSPLKTASDALSLSLKSAEQVSELQRNQKTWSSWLAEHPDHPDSGALMIVNTALSLTVHGASAALTGRPPQELDGANTGNQLRALSESLQPGDTEEKARLQEATLVLLGLDPQVRDVAMNQESAMALAKEQSPLGHVVRAVMLSRLETSIQALKTWPPDISTQVAMAVAGRVLCPRCADTHHLTPDKVSHMLLSGGNQGGVICPDAVKAGAQASTPMDEVGALTSCASLRPEGERVEGPSLWSTNAVVLGALSRIHDLSSAPLGEGTLVPLLNQQIERLKKLCEEPLMLPVSVVASPLDPGDGKGDWVMSIPELGAGGLVREKQATGTMILGADELRIGLRPTVTMTDGVMRSVSLAAGLPAGGRRIASRSEISELAKKGDARHLVASALAEVWLATQHGDPEKKEPAPETWAQLPVNLVLDARAPGDMVKTVMSTLKTLGAGSVAFAKTATHGALLHVLNGDAAPEVLETLDVGYERPLLAVAYADHVDLWRPTDPVGDPRTGRKPNELPSSLLPGFRGGDLQRLRLMLPDGADGLSLESLEQLRMGMAHLLALTGAGPMLHVVAGEGSRAADVIRIARVFQERPGVALKEPGKIWSGTLCGTEEHKKLNKTAVGCPTGVSVAFSSHPVPSGRGLSGTGKRTQAKGTSPPEKAGFCEKKNIQLNMKKRAGSFKFCYERELKLTRDLEGRVVFRFTIGRDGKVKGEPKVASSTLNSDPVHQCLSKNIKKVSFAKPDGGVCEVNWPFVFKPQ